MAYVSHFASPPLEILCLPLGPFQTNCYIVFHSGRKNALVIDPAEEPEVILSQLQERGLTAGAAVLTHGHCDHIGAATALAARGVPLLIHPSDAAKLSDPEASGAFYFGFNQEPCQPTRLLNEGDTVDLWEGASVLRVIHTPGHSSGSICLIGEGFAFVGDLLFAGGIGRTDLLGGDDEAMAESLRRILQLPDSTVVYPGHGPITTIGEERESNPFIAPAERES